MTRIQMERPAPSASPLWAGLAFSFVSSIGTGVVTNGIFFITKTAFGFTVPENYWLGLALGITYVAAAFLSGHAVRRLSRVASTRTVLVATTCLLAAACQVPLLEMLVSGRDRAALWTIWTLVAIYSPLTGILWPVTESFVSGGRRAGQLRSAIGRFNVTWAAALVAAYWAMGPLIERAPERMIASLGLGHILSVGLILALRREPGRHEHEAHEPHPPIYTQMLAVLRILLPTSYLVLTALLPYLPTVLLAHRVDPARLTQVASVWIIARVLTFALFERWHGWHGRWWPVVAGGLAMIAGFGATVVSDRLASGQAGLAVAAVGLLVFGSGMAVIYTAALYYAMEVGQADVDAGGVHEALIGVGYTVGPGCGLVAALTVPESNLDLSVLWIVGGLALLITGGAVLRALTAAPDAASAPRSG